MSEQQRKDRASTGECEFTKSRASEIRMPQNNHDNVMKDDDENDDDSALPALFMEGLPCNFATNPQLAAIACLLEDDDDESCPNDKVSKAKINNTCSRSALIPPTIPGGGKCRSSIRERRLLSAPSPYPVLKKPNRTSKSSVGEAQLFLKMWKLK